LLRTTAREAFNIQRPGVTRLLLFLAARIGYRFVGQGRRLGNFAGRLLLTLVVVLRIERVAGPFYRSAGQDEHGISALLVAVLTL
jgi:hypothetical protein